MSFTGRPIHAGFTLIALAMCGAAGCGHHTVRAKVPAAPARLGSTETGVASWYGIPYHGRRAASGEIYDMEKLTAAHPRLPFQTWVEVTNLTNGKCVDVRINDRGPFVHGRIIDLSQAAARNIDMLGPGIARVRLRVIAAPLVPSATTSKATGTTGPTGLSGPTGTASSPVPARPQPAPTVVTPPAVAIDWYAVQAGAFTDHYRADSLRITMEDIFTDARVIAGPRDLWRVVVGRQMTFDQAKELATRVSKEIGAALIVSEPEPDTPPDPALPQ